jgi:hypothetical protein
MADLQAADAKKELVRRISGHLEAAAGAARAAQAHAEAGHTDQALAMLRDVEPPLYEATALLNAASILVGNRTP